ncbi:MAG: ribonuclease catalytic domain-containing protein [bacterium]|nr:ribonuclease catalytic domain-containing protein [bacterium]
MAKKNNGNTYKDDIVSSIKLADVKMFKQLSLIDFEKVIDVSRRFIKTQVKKKKKVAEIKAYLKFMLQGLDGENPEKLEYVKNKFLFTCHSFAVNKTTDENRLAILNDFCEEVEKLHMKATKRVKISNDLGSQYMRLENEIFFNNNKASGDEIRNKAQTVKTLFLNNLELFDYPSNKKATIIDQIVDKFIMDEVESIAVAYYYLDIIETYLKLKNPKTDTINKYVNNIIVSGSKGKYLKMLLSSLREYLHKCRIIMQAKETNKVFSKKILSSIKPLELNTVNRDDLTNLLTITIDGEKTECIDDALSLVQEKDNTYTLYIHIVDIPSIVHHNSYLDQSAFQRGFTDYRHEIPVTMFPQVIAYNLGSFHRSHVRNALTLMVKFDEDFNLINPLEDVEVSKSLIVVDHNFTYNEVDNYLLKGNCDKEILTMLEKLVYISYNLKRNNGRKRKYRAIEKFAIECLQMNRSESNKKESFLTDVSFSANIVQETMVLYNKTIASIFTYLDLPFIYRCHETVTDNLLNGIIKDIQIYLYDNDYENKNEKYERLLAGISEVVCGSYYSANNVGHSGLGLDSYCHATAPARRYCDVLVQRLIDSLFLGDITDSKIEFWLDRILKVSFRLNKLQRQVDNYAKLSLERRR